jgi:hypothetical protein
MSMSLAKLTINPDLASEFAFRWGRYVSTLREGDASEISDPVAIGPDETGRLVYVAVPLDFATCLLQDEQFRTMRVEA